MSEQPATVLIVDDNDFARELLHERLAEDGYRLATAASGPEALDKAQELRPDVILLDVMMPHMDGFEVCRRLRADPELREIPVLMVTALDDSESKLRGIEAGADDFISKSYDPVELKARVRTITRLDRYRRLVGERRRLDWVVENSDDGYLLLADDDGLLDANPRARELLGLGPGSALPEASFLELAAGRYRCEPEDLWAEWPHPPATPLFLLRPESQHEGSFWLRVDQLASPDGRGRMVRLRDETARMATHRSLWRFSSLVDHKLRTALTMTLGSLDLLVADVERYSKAEVERIAQLAQRSGQRLQRQIQDVLTLLDAPDRAFGEEAMAVGRIEPLARELAAALKLPLTVQRREIDEHDHARLPLSAVAFELVLREVLANARAADVRVATAGTEPVATLELAVAEGQRGERRLRLAVLHDGGPFDADELARVWLPYNRAPGGRSGFGLSMVGPIVWGVGGGCRIRNRDDGPGIAIELELPLVPGPA